MIPHPRWGVAPRRSGRGRRHHGSLARVCLHRAAPPDMYLGRNRRVREPGKTITVFPHLWWACMIWIWLGFITLILVLLALDLGVFHRKAHVVTTAEALGWSAFWIAL